jgi:hypothetical protein
MNSTITILGEEKDVTLLDNATWTTAYRSMDDPDVVYLLVKRSDSTKDVLSTLPDHPNLPKIQFLEETYEGKLYKTRYYETVSYGDDQTQELIEKLDEIYWNSLVNYNGMTYPYDVALYRFLDSIKEHVPENIYDAFTMIVESMSYILGGDKLSIDVHEGNIAFDSEGNMILLDVVAYWKNGIGERPFTT